jgi:hypothetical protein
MAQNTPGGGSAWLWRRAPAGRRLGVGDGAERPPGGGSAWAIVKARHPSPGILDWVRVERRGP